MKRALIAFCAAAICITPAWAAADPRTTSCSILEVLSQNQVGQVESMIEEFAGSWARSSQTGAVNQFRQLLGTLPFDGGNVYTIAKLGEDLEEHIALLHLRGGEIAGLRLRYEWSAEGLQLTDLDFNREVGKLAVVPFAAPPEQITCN